MRILGLIIITLFSCTFNNKNVKQKSICINSDKINADITFGINSEYDNFIDSCLNSLIKNPKRIIDKSFYLIRSLDSLYKREERSNIDFSLVGPLFLK